MNGASSATSTPDDLPELIDSPVVRKTAAMNLTHSDDDDDADQDFDDDEEDDDSEPQEYRSLFGGHDKTFANVNELFNYEAKSHGFDLIDVIDRYHMTMIDYIKMINFIRSKVRSCLKERIINEIWL